MDRSTAAIDPRTTPARSDLAAKHLQGKVEAERFAEGEIYEVGVACAPLRRIPSPDASLDTEALMGERITIYEHNDEGWAWGQLANDDYVGFVPATALRRPGPVPTHKVIVLRTLVLPAPSVKLPPIEALSFGCRLAIAREEETFAVTATGAYIPRRHLAPVGNDESDFVSVAERFVGVPYLWGGKTSLGLDCSGLVQIAFNACGIACPRDSDMQEKALGSLVTTAGNSARLRRGDLLFWREHVAMARDAATLIHANAFHMAVAIEPIEEALARIRANGGNELSSVRRL
jgi:cell wall-associated NlpC family hydrolase